MKHIAFAKIGKSIKFTGSFSPTGGDNEPSAILKALANNNPDVTYYIVGRSDFKRLSESERTEMFPYGNVVDIWESAPFKTFSERKDYNDPFYHWIGEYFKINKIDVGCAVIMFGQVGTVTLPGVIEQVRDRSLTASVIDMTLNYTTPINMWLTTTKVPYVEIINDPRYTCAQARDLFHMPFASLGQYDYEFKHEPIKSLEDQDRVHMFMMSKYEGMETGFCVGRKVPKIETIYKSERFNIVLNEGSPSRYNMLKEWVLDNIDEVSVYGKWDHTEAQPDTDSRFKGSLNLDVLQARMSSTKYTFIIPIANGWVTSKYLEMIHIGVIPFFHPTYDTQRHLNVPDILRPDTPEKLMKIINYLDENDDARVALLKDLQDRILKPELYDGSTISTTIMKTCLQAEGLVYEKPDLTTYKKATVASLSDFF